MARHGPLSSLRKVRRGVCVGKLTATLVDQRDSDNDGWMDEATRRSRNAAENATTVSCIFLDQ
jgi:hypothetical protein